MIVLMPHKANAHTGKGFFFQRLAKAFREIGVKVVNNVNEPHDICLEYNSFKFKTNRPRVLRLNGVYHNTAMNWTKANADINKQAKKADGIIYQSKFCMHMHWKYIGLFPNYTVIGNGAPIRKPECTEPYVLAVARSRPHKRLRHAAKAAELADVPIVVCSGKTSREEVDHHMRRASALVYLSWLDWMPNSVVEALSCGCPVITNNVGGTKEMIKEGCGQVLELDEPYDMKPCDLYHPPKIDLSIVADAIRKSMFWDRVTNNEHVDIINIARKYEQYLHSRLR